LKSGNFILIYLWRAGEPKIYLLAAYFKGDKADISKREIDELLEKLNQNL